MRPKNCNTARTGSGTPTALLIKAVARQQESVELLLIGDGPDEQRLRDLSRTLGIADRVHFRGYVSETEKDALLRQCNIFSMVSLHEALGLAYLEAMHRGLPVLAGNVGGQLDFLTHEQTGLLVPPTDLEALSDNLRSLVASPELRHRLGENGRCRVSAYLAQETAPRFRKYLESVVSAPDLHTGVTNR